MKNFFLLLLSLLFFNCKRKEEQNYHLRLSNSYGISFNISIKKIGDNIEVKTFKDFIHYSDIEYSSSLDFEKYGDLDSIPNKDISIINEQLKRSNTKTIPFSKYPLILKHLDSIYKASKCELCKEVSQEGVIYCGIDIFTEINDKTDIYIEHKEEVKSSYNYLFSMIKKEFNDNIIETEINPILKYFDIDYLILNETPLLVEVYDNYYKYGENKNVKYDFPYSKNIYFLLKGRLNLSENNIKSLKEKFDNIYIISDINSFEIINNETEDPEKNDLSYKPHFQEIENTFSNIISDIRFDFNYKKTNYNSFINYEANGNFHSKSLSFTDQFETEPMYIFQSYITGFKIGLSFSSENKIEIWDNRYYDESNCTYSHSEYPLIFFDDNNTEKKYVYKIDNSKNKFEINITNEKDSIIEGNFKGTLYNSLKDSIQIGKGKFIIDTKQKK